MCRSAAWMNFVTILNSSKHLGLRRGRLAALGQGELVNSGQAMTRPL